MNEKTEAASPKGLEGAPEAVRSAAPTEPSKRRRWRPEELRGADLRGQDLRDVEGLLPEHLAGAVLTGATLPDHFTRFEALGQVAAISSEARKIFIGLLAACVYSWLVIGTTKDVALILNTSSSPLPIINAPIPITGFYVVGATLLAAIYCYFHFYLQPLWRRSPPCPRSSGMASRKTTRPIPGSSPIWSAPSSPSYAQPPRRSRAWKIGSRSSWPGGSCRSLCSRSGRATSPPTTSAA